MRSSRPFNLAPRVHATHRATCTCRPVGKTPRDRGPGHSLDLFPADNHPTNYDASTTDGSVRCWFLVPSGLNASDSICASFANAAQLVEVTRRRARTASFDDGPSCIGPSLRTRISFPLVKIIVKDPCCCREQLQPRRYLPEQAPFHMLLRPPGHARSLHQPCLCREQPNNTARRRSRSPINPSDFAAA